MADQRGAEEALRESEARFRAMFEGAPIGISLLDAEGRYLAVNPARLRMLGYTEEELIGRHFRDVTHEEDVEYDRQVNDQARERGDHNFQLEKRFLRADGSVAWTRITVSMVPDRAGNPEYFIALAEDITARKEAEEERARLFELERAARRQLEQLAAEREAVLGQIAEGIIIADPQGRITFVNDAARVLHGLAELGVSVEGYSDTYHLYTVDGQPYPPEELTLSRAVLKGETVVNDRVRIRRPDGTEVVAEASATPVVGQDGRRLGAVLSVRDITAQYDLQRQKDEFLSSVAHDLRTPLTSIKGRVQLLQRRAEHGSLEPKLVAEELDKIDGNVTRMIALISELLDVANIQMGRRVSLVPQRVDLVMLARDVVHEQQQATQSHVITFRSQVGELMGMWDASRIERVLANLISNALKYSPGGGQVSVEVKQCEEEGMIWALVQVRDEGIGIPADDLPHIFERFHRGANVSGRIPGTGIGLAAAQEIVEQHGGSISVQSQEGVGSTFTVRLPARA
jgi:PAS domain S-box-containing protein